MKGQIEEMARDICHLGVPCDECTMLARQIGQSKEQYCKAMQYAKRAYEKGYRKQSEWISVEERLPKRRKKCLCYYPQKDYGSKVVVDYAETDDGYFAEQYKFGAPSHWIPLPEPPKMKGGA